MPNKKLAIVLITFIFVLVVGYGAFLLYVSWPVYFGNIDKAGVFGDSFGVITSLFSGLAFLGIILTILLQRDELKLQRKELELTRGELKGQKEQLKAQNATLKKQNYENTFFQLLHLHNETTNSIECTQGSATFKGKNCFNFLFQKYAGDYGSLPQVQGEKNKINQAYNTFYGRHKHEVSHYFRTIYAIVKFIESSEVENVELYVNLIRVQLTDRELLLLFYHSLGDDRKEFKPLIEKYSLFESLPKVNLLKKEHVSLYKDSAYNILSINVCN